ncbi:MAG: DMT family transporter [Candidatus Roizmanbacteria bacterium]|nr:DMT family transporter [Candidatus Roizmanbacteria bacterium]
MLSNPRLKAYIALISVAAMWGLASVIIKGTLEHLEPMTFLYFRFIMILPLTIPWYIWYLKKYPLKRSEIVPLTIFSFVATTFYLSLIFWGFERTTAIDGNLLGTLNPIFIVLLGVLILKEHVTLREKMGFGLAIIGTMITVVQPLLEGNTFALENTWGNIIILIASMVWALFVLYSKKNFKHFSPLLITLHGSLVAGVTYPLLAYLENGFTLPSFTLLFSNHMVFWGVFYMAFVSYVLAYILYEYGMSKIEISQGSVFTYLQPLFATPLAVIFLGEMVTIPFIIGAGIIFAGVVLSEWK